MAGLTIVIVLNELIAKHMRLLPNILNYRLKQKDRSVHNNALTFAIYMSNLCVQWVLARGGLENIDRLSGEKSQLLYDLID